MHAIKMQTEIGREISEKGIVPELPYFGPFWDNDNQPLFEEIDIDPNDLGSFPEGTVLKVDMWQRYDSRLISATRRVGLRRFPSWLTLSTTMQRPLSICVSSSTRCTSLHAIAQTRRPSRIFATPTLCTGVMIPSNSESNHTTPTTHTSPHI